ncbi:MAG: calcium/sodium antiporter [bacterium]|nr:calcium/sodium antiporter [bacterium]
MYDFTLILLGTGLLYFGGELLVTHSARLARIWGLSSLTIGLTVVAFGTSSPELAASITAALKGQPALAIGNVVGSNIANIGLILGLCALLRPLTVEWSLVKRETPILIASAILLAPLLWDGVLTRFEGLVLIVLIVAYTVYILRLSRKEPLEPSLSREAAPSGGGSAWFALAGAGVGVVVLAGGANLLVEGGANIARAFGVSEKVIGLTLVAVGTSLPELASSIIAALKKESDIVLGNIVGSNIFNSLCILGAAALASPLEMQWAAIQYDCFVMLAFSLALWPCLYTGQRLSRLEGSLFLIAYATYVGYLYAG